jgi:hypothetical protein
MRVTLNFLVDKLECLERSLRIVPIVEQLADSGGQRGVKVSLLEWVLLLPVGFDTSARELERLSRDTLEALKTTIHLEGSSAAT